MRFPRAGAVLILTLAIPAAVVVDTGSRVYADPLHKGCASAGYSHNNSICLVVPSKGKFTIKIPGTTVNLKGTGSSGTSGTQITVTKLAPPVPSKGGFGVKVRATGKFGPLHISPGRVWKYNAARNSLKSVSAVASSGVYQVTK